MARGDEIGVLAREFDRMVGRLAEARRRLLEQSYKAGVAEMASGVLHNVGNALTPVGVKLTKVTQALREAPATDLEMALGELADSATPAPRHADLAAFAELAGRELARLAKWALGELDAAKAQVDNAQLILSDQQRYSRAERVFEPVAVPELVEESLKLLPEALREAMQVQVAPEALQLGSVYAPRVALQQVFANLLINAAEAISARGADMGGTLTIYGERQLVDGVAMAHLRFADDGAGIAPEHLSRIFERGFSTKARGSGMGLHWSANTIGSMGGQIFAESEGPGRGARLHLLLPLAEPGVEALHNAA